MRQPVLGPPLARRRLVVGPHRLRVPELALPVQSAPPDPPQRRLRGGGGGGGGGFERAGALELRLRRILWGSGERGAFERMNHTISWLDYTTSHVL